MVALLCVVHFRFYRRRHIFRNEPHIETVAATALRRRAQANAPAA